LNEEENQSLAKAHQEHFCWEELQTEADLEKAFEEAERIRVQIQLIEKELETARAASEKENNQKELYCNALESIKSHSLKEQATADTLVEQLVLLDLKAYCHRNPDDLNAEKEILLQHHATIEQKYQKALDEMNLLRKDQDILSGKLETNRKMLAKEQVLLDNMATEIEKQLRNSQYASLAEVNDILAWNPELEKERHRTSVFRQELDFVEKQLHLLQSELKAQTFEEEAYQQLRLDIQSLQAEIGRKNEEKGSFQAILAKMMADLEKRIHFQVLLEKTEQRLVNIRVLKQLFKGSGFVRYISSVYLQELVQAANERFYKLSGQKLRLEITPGNDFEIRDFMNDGKTRNVKTLSGGQTFQAALSLALALSDNTRKLSGTGENFFFLDEGFGSLDKESLQVVFDTLKALRHENRIVGIISHVEDMNQEIDIHLRIRNEEEKGSVIERSWEREN
jgi:exonuclease SbcC